MYSFLSTLTEFSSWLVKANDQPSINIFDPIITVFFKTPNTFHIDDDRILLNFLHDLFLVEKCQRLCLKYLRLKMMLKPKAAIGG